MPERLPQNEVRCGSTLPEVADHSAAAPCDSNQLADGCRAKSNPYLLPHPERGIPPHAQMLHEKSRGSNGGSRSTTGRSEATAQKYRHHSDVRDRAQRILE